MRLAWEVNGDGVLIASHPVEQWEYEVHRNGDGWTASLEDSFLFSGRLEECLAACRRDAGEARRQQRISDLRREINRLERSEGGNWRKLRRTFAKREQLTKLENAR